MDGMDFCCRERLPLAIPWIQVEKAQVVGYSWGRPLPEEGAGGWFMLLIEEGMG